MNKPEIDVVLALIEGIQNQLNAVKALLHPTPEASNECPHNDMTTISTMGGVQGAFCSDCGAEFVMGVLDKDENNE
jgi:hypothetical protein